MGMAVDGEMERLRIENQQLRKTVEHLELQVEELGVECDDLRQICAANNIRVGDALAVRRHHRMFAKACADHPLGSMEAASEVISAVEISRTKLPQTRRISQSRKQGESRRNSVEALAVEDHYES